MSNSKYAHSSSTTIGNEMRHDSDSYQRPNLPSSSFISFSEAIIMIQISTFSETEAEAMMRVVSPS